MSGVIQKTRPAQRLFSLILVYYWAIQYTQTTGEAAERGNLTYYLYIVPIVLFVLISAILDHVGRNAGHRGAFGRWLPHAAPDRIPPRPARRHGVLRRWDRRLRLHIDRFRNCCACCRAGQPDQFLSVPIDGCGRGQGCDRRDELSDASMARTFPDRPAESGLRDWNLPLLPRFRKNSGN